MAGLRKCTFEVGWYFLLPLSLALTREDMDCPESYPVCDRTLKFGIHNEAVLRMQKVASEREGSLAPKSHNKLRVKIY